MIKMVKGFVASWFFPPATSSEGIVTYKLLRNSAFQYDVCSSLSKQWGYATEMEVNATNIRVFSIDTDDIDTWVQKAVDLFEERYPYEKYDFIMTRSTPPESILVGSKIKELHPEIKWIASFGDPIANNPYELRAYIDDCATLSDKQKQMLKADLKKDYGKWESRAEAGIRLLCKLKHWENIIFEFADCIICPSSVQMQYALNSNIWRDKYFVVPHTYDSEFFSNGDIHTLKNEKIVFSFLGYSDQYRSLLPLVQAIYMLQLEYGDIAERASFCLVGNIPQEVKDMVYNYFLQDCIHIKSSVDYKSSLKIMQTSDWLIHVDAYFPEIETGGSIFFAGKLADYLGSGKPIFALTGEGSPADKMVHLAGGVSASPNDVYAIADCLIKILSGEKPTINSYYRKQFDSKIVAEHFDRRINNLLGYHNFSVRTNWLQVPEQGGEKIITVCVPAYNVASYLDRCLYSLVSGKLSGLLEVLVINDGSTDSTQSIADEYQRHYPNIIKVINKENGGHGSTINIALDIASGTYFMVVDGDDWIDSDQMSKLIHDIKECRSNVDLISYNYHHIDMSSGKREPQVQSAQIVYDKIIEFHELDYENVYFTLAGSLFRTDVLKKSGLKIQEKTYYVDVEYILFPIPFIETVLFKNYYIYKYFKGNVSQSVHIPNMVNRYEHHDRVIRRVISYYQDQSMGNSQRQYYKQIVKKLLYTHYALMLVYDNEKSRGYNRCRQFDKFLLTMNQELFDWSGHAFKQLKIARKLNYDYIAIEKMKFPIGNKSVKNNIKKLFKLLIKNPILSNIILNSKIIRWLWRHSIGETNLGFKIKAFLNKS